MNDAHMAGGPLDFLRESIKIAERFLQTAVVIDDEAFVPTLPVPKTAVTPKSIDGPSPAADSTAPPADTDTKTDPEALDPQPLIEGFGKKGIACAVIAPDKNDDLTSSASPAVKLASRCDIAVVDWSMHQDNGKRALELIRSILKESLGTRPWQLRLVVIYTGDPKLLDIATQVETVMNNVPDGPPMKKVDELTLLKGAVRVVIYGKTGGIRRDPQYSEHLVSYDALPDRATHEFAEMTAGLVSNLVLSAMAELREQSHRMLTQFGPSLDCAFLAHRSLLDPPDEADDHVIDLIVSEMQAILEQQPGIRQIQDETISSWLTFRHQSATEFEKVTGIKDQELAKRAIRDLCVDGTKKVFESGKYGIGWLKDIIEDTDKNSLDKLSKAIACSDDEALDQALALLMMIRTRYRADAPLLTLGTITSQTEAGSTKYFLCLQPRCDSLRLATTRNFPMLRLTKPDGGKLFNLVAQDSTGTVRLRIDPRAFKCEVFRFDPAPATKTVTASKRDKDWYFKSKDNEEFRFMGELRSEFSQRAVQEFASALARVGLTESEWLRLWAKPNKLVT